MWFALSRSDKAAAAATPVYSQGPGALQAESERTTGNSSGVNERLRQTDSDSGQRQEAPALTS